MHASLKITVPLQYIKLYTGLYALEETATLNMNFAFTIFSQFTKKLLSNFEPWKSLKLRNLEGTGLTLGYLEKKYGLKCCGTTMSTPK